MIDLTTLTIAKARSDLDTGVYTAQELASEYLDRISKMNPELNAYLEVYEDVQEQAEKADKMISEGSIKSLTGIPIAIKDNILNKGKRASSGSKILEGYVASYNATVVEKLQAEGAVILGRTNMDEFALGSSTENSAYGPTKNPHDTTRVPGGTSGGSAAAVAANLCLAALGSDTGGSIRQPASFCGVVGIKPTYGAVSRFGLMAAASSLDQIGTLAKTVEDAKTVLSAISGYDANDSTSLSEDTFDTKRSKPKVIGVPRAFLKEGIDDDVLEQFEAALARSKKEGYAIKDIELPELAGALAAYYIINPAEVSSNLSRFDGMRYGYSAEAGTVREVYETTRAGGFGDEVRRRILTGAFVLSSGYVDAYYRRAMALRTTLRTAFSRAFKEVDLIALPTSPMPAFKLGEKSDPTAMYAADIFTVPVNLSGVPAISVPNGTVVRDGKDLPNGLQLIGAHGEEDAIFLAATDLTNN